MITLILVAAYFWVAGAVSECTRNIQGSKEIVVGYDARILVIGITWPYWLFLCKSGGRHE